MAVGRIDGALLQRERQRILRLPRTADARVLEVMALIDSELVFAELAASRLAGEKRD